MDVIIEVINTHDESEPNIDTNNQNKTTRKQQFRLHRDSLTENRIKTKATRFNTHQLNEINTAFNSRNQILKKCTTHKATTHKCVKLSINSDEMDKNRVDLSSSTLSTTNKTKHVHAKRVMSADKCSDTFRDVISSLINENLLSYSKYYDDYMDLNGSELNSNSEDTDSLNYQNHLKSDSGSHKKSVLKTSRKKSLTTKNLMFCDSIENEQRKCKSELLENKNFVHSKTRPGTCYNYSKPLPGPSLGLNSKFDLRNKENQRAMSSNVRGYTPNQSAKRVIGSSASFARMSDLIFEGYEKKEALRSASTDLHDDEEIYIHRNNVKEYPNISPLFKVKLYNVLDKKELLLAKEDLYKRYSFCIDTSASGASRRKSVSSSVNKK